MVSISLPVLGGLLPGTPGDDQYIGTTKGIQSAIIRAEEGNDTVIGINRDPDILTDGISNSFISTGDGDDLVIGIAFPDSEGTNFGISGGVIELGDGNDTLIAGGIAGVNNVVIDGGAGDDLLNVGSGNGTISGGEGSFDILALDGNFSEFRFFDYDLSPDVSGSGILVESVDTNLITFGIEIFRFDDGDVLASNIELEDLFS